MRPTVGATAIVLVLAGCGGGAGSVAVSAASSLTDAFTVIEAEFEALNPGVDVVMNFGGSSTLAAQIRAGAEVDAFATADPVHLDGIAEGTVFARNEIVIATPPGNPAGISGLADFGDPEPYLGLCIEGVPCGELARSALAAAGVEPDVDTLEPDVRSLVTKLLAGELDGGIVYRTDLDGLDGVEVPDRYRAAATYEVAALDSDGQAFVDFVLSPRGEEILVEHGFAVAP